MGEATIKMIQNAFRSALVPQAINQTFLVLIPKVKQVTIFNHIRPMSLCNSSYKILAKLITERIWPVMDKIISPYQSAFIPGRWIGETTILVNEIIHSMKKKGRGNGIVGFKIDLMKAYDIVD